jgi:glutathione peroxidase
MNAYDFSVRTAAGTTTSLDVYRGKVTVMVNVASKCGLTPQYRDLQALYDAYRDSGLVILGFPCNQFADQEPGTDLEIQETCKRNYGVTFPVFSKIEVNGPGADPLYAYLKSRKGGFLTKDIKWNFTKFLIDQNGNVIRRYAPTVALKKMEPDIRKLLRLG